jgi:hypothetical protein
MATQTVTSLGKVMRTAEASRWTERRAMALWLGGSVLGWAVVLGLGYLALTLI